jgi:hypothetical protein
MPRFDNDRSLVFKEPAKLRGRDSVLDLDVRDSESVLDIDVDRDLAEPDSLLTSDMIDVHLPKKLQRENYKLYAKGNYVDVQD